MEIPAYLATSLGMAIHELTTNAVKYGALSVRGARLAVSWHLQADRLALDWEERDVPAVHAPITTGFGTQLLTRVLPGQFRASVELDYAADGLKARLGFPLGGVL